jgi:hypothetical protein
VIAVYVRAGSGKANVKVVALALPRMSRRRLTVGIMLSLIGNVPIIMPRICIGGSKKTGLSRASSGMTAPESAAIASP